MGKHATESGLGKSGSVLGKMKIGEVDNIENMWKHATDSGLEKSGSVPGEKLRRRTEVAAETPSAGSEGVFSANVKVVGFGSNLKLELPEHAPASARWSFDGISTLIFPWFRRKNFPSVVHKDNMEEARHRCRTREKWVGSRQNENWGGCQHRKFSKSKSRKMCFLQKWPYSTQTRKLNLASVPKLVS